MRHYTEAELEFGGEMSEATRKLPGSSEVVSCPVEHPNLPGHTSRMTVHGAVMHLNDFHEWPRESIADWLDGLDIDDQIAFGEKQ